MLAKGDVVRVDFPGHERHKKNVEIHHIEEDFDAFPIHGKVIFVTWSGQPTPIGMNPSHLAGTWEHQALARERHPAADEPVQGELTL